ncbi:MAG: competence protein CoiA family protein [Candidatus Limivicinus sp.]|nr:competence protein CoiA family protein [Candidatus Limivicinus sp.]
MSGNIRKVQLEYGLRGDKVIFVSELTDLERGKACNCICPVCRKQLVAKLGPHNQWHFAHDGAECNLVAAQQTALHMLAKEIIESSKKLRFPGISIKKDDYCNDIEDFRVQAEIPSSIEYRKASVVNCDSVSLEKKISSIVPDIMVTAKARKCLIEVAVTHFVDEEKEQKIKEIGLPLFEIDLSNLYNSEFSREELAEEVLFNPSNRTWIFNPLFEAAKMWAKEQYIKIIQSAEEKVKRQDEKESVREKKKQQRREIGEKRIQDIFELDNYKKTVAALENEEEAAKQFKQLHMKTDIDKLPFFLNIPITGEMVFPCDRRIWQSALFDKFVFNRNSEGENKPTVHIKRVQTWIKKHNKQFPIDWGLTYKTEVLVSREEKKTVLLLYDVVYTFFDYLVYLGFLEHFICQEAVLRQSHSLEPPNRDHAEILYDAINKVDWYDPAVNDRIKQFLTPTKSVRNTYLPRNRMLLNEMENQETISPKTNREDSKNVNEPKGKLVVAVPFSCNNQTTKNITQD